MRINVIPPNLLLDQHLFAEFREIKMLPKMFLRSKNSKQGLGTFGGKYTLNAGHGKCFYDKFNFIETRFEELKKEVLSRDYDIKDEFLFLDLTKIPKEFFGDYVPTPEAIRINSERIIERVLDKPSFYKYYHKPINFLSYKSYLENLSLN
jgi:deoxyribonuclease (pyrimidine dimer)